MLSKLKSLIPARFSSQRREVVARKEFLAAIAQASGLKVMAVEAMFDGMLGRDGVPISMLGNYEHYLKAGTGKVWATWKACDIIGQVCMDTRYAVFKEGGQDPARLPELELLLKNPNGFECFEDMLYKWVFHIKLTGMAFWYKADATLTGDRPKKLLALNPKRMRLSLDKNNVPIGYIYHTAGKDIPFDPQELIVWRRPHPDNDFWGLGDVEAGAGLFNEFINRETWQQKFWKNGAAPSGLLMCEDQITDEKEFEKAKLKWKKEYQGSENSGKVAWLTGKWEYRQVGLTAVEMQNIEASRFNLEQIFHQHGVPLSIVGMREAANYATADIDDRSFRAYAVKPMLTRFSAEFTRSLVKGYNPSMELRYNLSGLTNIAQVVTDYGPLFDRGVVSINELREKVGLPQITGDPLFDQHFVISTYVPLDLAGVASSQNAVNGQAADVVKKFLEQHLGNGADVRKALHGSRLLT